MCRTEFGLQIVTIYLDRAMKENSKNCIAALKLKTPFVGKNLLDNNFLDFIFLKFYAPIICAVLSSNESLREKIRKLEKDILNAPAHYFGCHEQCSSYFCKKTTDPHATNTIKLLKDDGLYYEIQSLCQTSFGNNARSLLANYTNNPAEQLNSYVAKYLGGKRINYSLAGSYEARVAMAVVHFNTNCQAGSEYRKMKFGGVSDIPRVTELEMKRKRKCEKNAIRRTKKPRVRKSDPEKGRAYGGYYAEDMKHDTLEAAMNRTMEKLVRNKMNRLSIEHISKENGQYCQEKCSDMLLSHYFSAIINSKGPKFYAKILLEVMYTQAQLGNNAKNKHQRVQEVEALATFSRLYAKYPIDECGLVIDEELPYLGALPFRYYGSDHLLSIKCPLSAYKKSIAEAKLQFWKVESGKKTLNKKSTWYLEIQGELHVTKRKTTFLMIWLGESQYQVVQVKRDDAFFDSKMRGKLVSFFNDVMLKELANSRKARGMELRQYDEATKTFL
ncbi:hypothetical protein Bhyg_12335 [Pseudolycoriella hygida]|uniref:Uncharacterized protein n=1 Tax=Pseudolycoriella hygida TaxID=35572 RepID=A0A9Q0S164_9DIPT|nr:hypothetical protein Bhyg_12335 [Pseudolycoriella hygida]